jgi:hypothetical protein
MSVLYLTVQFSCSGNFLFPVVISIPTESINNKLKEKRSFGFKREGIKGIRQNARYY